MKVHFKNIKRCDEVIAGKLKARKQRQAGSSLTRRVSNYAPPTLAHVCHLTLIPWCLARSCFVAAASRPQFLVLVITAARRRSH